MFYIQIDDMHALFCCTSFDRPWDTFL